MESNSHSSRSIRRGKCEPITSIFPCTEDGIRDAIAEGGGPHGFVCDGPVVTGDVISINNDVILDGLGNLTVDGNNDHLVFSVEEGVTAELHRLTVTGGSAAVPGGVGGIYSKGVLTLANSTVSRNTGVAVGGIFNEEGILSMTNTTVAGNTATEFGGVANTGTMTITSSTVSRNIVAPGSQLGTGGVVNGGTMTIINSTVSRNTGDFVGGITNFNGMLTITNSTLARNDTDDTDGVGDIAGSGILITNSVVVGDCSAAITSGGYNIESPGSTCGLTGPGDQDGSAGPPNLNLGPLQNNGGPTETHALEPGSSAIDVIPEAMCEVATDQRGVARPQGSACDVGAVEVEP